tara:strand:+ start:433 stop:552 length:120 start_codon:yes stop_codon:yes gene_type:complete
LIKIYYAVGNANTKRQETKFGAFMGKSNSAGWLSRYEQQ